MRDARTTAASADDRPDSMPWCHEGHAGDTRHDDGVNAHRVAELGQIRAERVNRFETAGHVNLASKRCI